MGINLSKTRNMKYVVERAGLSWDEANKIIGNKDWHDEIELNRKTIYADGLWGVPSFRLLKDKRQFIQRGDKTGSGFYQEFFLSFLISFH